MDFPLPGDLGIVRRRFEGKKNKGVEMLVMPWPLYAFSTLLRSGNVGPGAGPNGPRDKARV